MSVGFTTGPIIGDPIPTGYVPSTAAETAEWGSSPFARGLAREEIETGVDPQTGMVIGPPAPEISAADANARYGIEGQLRFDNPIADEAAQQIYDAKRDELARKDAGARRPPGLWNAAGTFGAGLIASALDPVNVAATMVPGVGEARWATAAENAAGPLARAAIRFGAGTAAAAQAQIPLTALRYGLSRQEQADYSATDALLDIAYGSLLGGGLHAAIGGAGDWVGERFRSSPEAAAADASLDTREAALRTALAQLGEGRPVEVRPVFDAALRGDLEGSTALGSAVPLPGEEPAPAGRGLAEALRAAAGEPDADTVALGRTAAAAEAEARGGRPLDQVAQQTAELQQALGQGGQPNLNSAGPLERDRPAGAEPQEGPANSNSPGPPGSELAAPETNFARRPGEPELAAAEEGQRQAEGLARAFQRAAQCLIGGE